MNRHKNKSMPKSFLINISLSKHCFKMYTEPHGKAVIRLREFASMARGGIKQPRNSLLVVLGMQDRSKEWAVTCSFVLKSSFTGYAVYNGNLEGEFCSALQ